MTISWQTWEIIFFQWIINAISIVVVVVVDVIQLFSENNSHWICTLLNAHTHTHTRQSTWLGCNSSVAKIDCQSIQRKRSKCNPMVVSSVDHICYLLLANAKPTMNRINIICVCVWVWRNQMHNKMYERKRQ